MATTTPNLGLTLPIGSEKVSRQILNGNFSLIDTAYGTLNSNFVDIGSASSTFEQFKSALLTKVAKMPNASVSFLYIQTTAAFAPFGGGGYIVKINKASSSYQTFECMYAAGYGSSVIYPIYLANENGTWYVNDLNSKIENYWTVVNEVEYFTAQAANTLEYTGVSVAVPANSIYCFTGYGVYSFAQPEAAAISISSSTLLTYECVGKSVDGSCVANICGYTNTACTFYLYCSWSSAGTSNPAKLCGFYKCLS